jgi:hypothetical protein
MHTQLEDILPALHDGGTGLHAGEDDRLCAPSTVCENRTDDDQVGRKKRV